MSPRILVVSTLLALSFTALGCNPPSNPEPPDAFRRDGGPVDANLPDAFAGLDAGPSDAGLDAFVGDDANLDAGPLPDGGADAGCQGTAGCFSCAPSTTHQEQFLNHCTTPGVTCQSFPNTATRLPHLRSDGTLPPLP